MDRPDSDSWLEACQDELLSLKETWTYELVNIDEVDSNNIVGCRWVFAIKMAADCSVECYKVRIVEKVFSQVYQVDNDQTFAPVVNWSPLPSLLALPPRLVL